MGRDVGWLPEHRFPHSREVTPGDYRQSDKDDDGINLSNVAKRNRAKK